MGASKRLAEMIVQAFAEKENKSILKNKKYIKFLMVRFGNVLGSSGSVIPLLKSKSKMEVLLLYSIVKLQDFL